MGRTVAPFREVLKRDLQTLEKFKRALRKPDREAFEEMLYQARLHAQAGNYASLMDPFEVIVLGILIEHEKKLRGKRIESDLR